MCGGSPFSWRQHLEGPVEGRQVDGDGADEGDGDVERAEAGLLLEFVEVIGLGFGLWRGEGDPEFLEEGHGHPFYSKPAPRRDAWLELQLASRGWRVLLSNRSKPVACRIRKFGGEVRSWRVLSRGDRGLQRYQVTLGEGHSSLEARKPATRCWHRV